MPTTKQQALKAIENINDGGNNTAVEVRDALIKTLEYTERTPLANQASHFHFWTESKPVQDRTNKNKLFYSFKGAEEANGFVNLTFDLAIANASDNNTYTFPFQTNHRNELSERLRKIVNAEQKLSFVVPTLVARANAAGRGTVLTHFRATTNTGIVQIPLSVELDFSKAGFITFDFLPFMNSKEFDLKRGAKVKTSISLHAPDFKN